MIGAKARWAWAEVYRSMSQFFRSAWAQVWNMADGCLLYPATSQRQPACCLVQRTFSPRFSPQRIWNLYRYLFSPASANNERSHCYAYLSMKKQLCRTRGIKYRAHGLAQVSAVEWYTTGFVCRRRGSRGVLRAIHVLYLCSRSSFAFDRTRILHHTIEYRWKEDHILESARCVPISSQIRFRAVKQGLILEW
jgi:hypothetical protein